MPSASSASATPQTSPSASSAPTSWKCTSLGLDAVHARLGRGQRRETASSARARAGRQRRRVEDLAHAPSSGGRASGGATTRHASGGDPVPRRTRSRRRSSPSTPRARPAAADVVGAAPGVDQRRQQHVAGDAADAVDVRDALTRAAARRAIARRDRPGAEAVVDVDDREPAAHEVSIASSAVTPPKARRSPTLVGTPITGAATSPPTTQASAASMPATTITQSARAGRAAPARAGGARPRRRPRGRSPRVPSSSARMRASCTAGPSEVPAETIDHEPALPRRRARDPGAASALVLARVRCHARTAARASSSARVTRTLAGACSSSAARSPRSPRASCPPRAPPRARPGAARGEVDAREAEVVVGDPSQPLEPRGRDVEPTRRDGLEQLLDVAGEPRSLERGHVPVEPLGPISAIVEVGSIRGIRISWRT